MLVETVEYVKERQAFGAPLATAGIAKVSTTEMQGRVADTCLQLYGGYGFMCEYGISRAFVDARVQRIYGGSNETILHRIASDPAEDRRKRSFVVESFRQLPNSESDAREQ